MIKIKLNQKKKTARIKFKGTAHNLAVETATLIENIYLELLARNPEAADEYKRKIIAFSIDPTSTLWTGGLENEQ